MLTNERLTIVAETVLDDVKIASYGAVLNLDNMDLSLTNRYIDKEACKMHKDVVREDNRAFEDLAYMIQDQLMASKESED